MPELGHKTEGKLLNIAFKDYYEKISPKIIFTKHFGESKPKKHFEEYSKKQEHNNNNGSRSKKEIHRIGHNPFRPLPFLRF
jgi:hypothetical protein